MVVLGLDTRRSLDLAESRLRQAEALVRADDSLVDVVAHPRIRAWRQAFTAFGARPSKYQSAVEALVRRARRGDTLPVINTTVGLYNACSLRRLLPVGGDDLDRLSGRLELRLARGDEPFYTLGTDELDPPIRGEVVYVDAVQVLCRRWSWRQSERTRIADVTRNALLNVHGLPPAEPRQVEVATRELAQEIREACGGLVAWYVLTRASPERTMVFSDIR